MPWGVAVLGIIVGVLGVMLAADPRGSAGAYAATIKDHKPTGVDYSRSFFANPKFIRIFGAVLALIGIGFIIGSTIMASQMS